MLEGKPHSLNRLRTELVGWLTTVGANGKPSTAPVWFLIEDDDSILVYSRDPSVRVRNIAANPQVTLALNADPLGHDIVVVNGTARIDRSAPPASEHEAFLDKYRTRLDANEWAPEWFAHNYPAAVLIKIGSIRGR